MTDLCPACRRDIHVWRDETDPPRRAVYVAACDCTYSAEDGYGSESEDEALAKLKRADTLTTQQVTDELRQWRERQALGRGVGK